MSGNIKSKRIADGITFTAIPDSRFKTNRLTVHFIERLNDDTVTENALIPAVLQDGFVGCEDFTLLNRRLEMLYGARVETEVQKRGDSQVLSVSITGIDDRFVSDRSISGEMAEILCGILFCPLIEENGFQRKYTELEKAAQADAIDAQINNKRSYAIQRMTAIMCQAEPFGIPKYGRKDVLASITPQSLKQRYDALLSRARIEVMFTGCGDAAAAEQVLRRFLCSIHRDYRDFLVTEAHSLSNSKPQEQIDHLSVNQAKLVMGFGCGISPLDDTVPAMRLMTAILGGTPSSKLFVNVREKLSLCYYCAARLDTYKGIMMIDSGVEQQNVEQAKREILKQIDAICRGEMTEDEINAALLSLKNGYSTIGESDSAIESFYLGQLLIGLGSTPEAEKAKLDRVQKQDIINAAHRLRLEAVYLLTGKEED